MSNVEIAERFEHLSADVRAELEDENFINRTHYRRATYAVGCHGPLCRLAETRRGRERNEAAAIAAGRQYTPNLTARQIAREGELDVVITMMEWIQSTPQ